MTAHFPNSTELVSEVIDAHPRRGIYRSFLKRVFDILFVLAAGVVVLPLTMVLASLVALDGHSPFFVQDRVGRDGRVFRMVKLRSMVRDADRHLADFLARDARAREEWTRTQKLRRDPRITPVGRLIRKCSLDELPQFWNVLAGDMSVVGPRPMMPSQRDLYPGQAYYALRPGVTGLWQVGDRNNTSFAARAKFDTEYYRCVGFVADLWIIIRTIRVMLHGTGV